MLVLFHGFSINYPPWALTGFITPHTPKTLPVLYSISGNTGKDKGLLIKDLAKIIGVTEDTIINWEVRERRPCDKRMERLSDFIPGIEKSADK